MRWFVFLFVFLIANSHADVEQVDAYKDIHPEFVSHTKRFLVKSSGYLDESDIEGLTMQFGETDDAIGVCFPIPGNPIIFINEQWWSYHQDRVAREMLIFHELGHCVLNREHTEPSGASGFVPFVEKLLFDIGVFTQKTRLYDTCPASLMHPRLVSDWCKYKHYNFYIDELFGFTDTEEYEEHVFKHRRIEYGE